MIFDLTQPGSVGDVRKAHNVRPPPCLTTYLPPLGKNTHTCTKPDRRRRWYVQVRLFPHINSARTIHLLHLTRTLDEIVVRSPDNSGRDIHRYLNSSTANGTQVEAGLGVGFDLQVL